MRMSGNQEGAIALETRGQKIVRRGHLSLRVCLDRAGVLVEKGQPGLGTMRVMAARARVVMTMMVIVLATVIGMVAVIIMMMTCIVAQVLVCDGPMYCQTKYLKANLFFHNLQLVECTRKYQLPCMTRWSAMEQILARTPNILGKITPLMMLTAMQRQLQLQNLLPLTMGLFLDSAVTSSTMILSANASKTP